MIERRKAPRARAALLKTALISAGYFIFLINDANALSCREFGERARSAIKSHVAALQRLEHEASDRLKGLDSRPFAFLRDEAKKITATIADPAALKEEEELKGCRNTMPPIRKICADAAQALLDILDKHVADPKPAYDKPQYASVTAACEDWMHLKPPKSVIRGTD